jgi:hypothetical protein
LDTVLLEANPLEDIANARQVAGTMVRGRWYARADLDRMLEMVAWDYEAFKTTQTIVKIAFPVAVVLSLVVVVWLVIQRGRVRRRKARQASS